MKVLPASRRALLLTASIAMLAYAAAANSQDSSAAVNYPQRQVHLIVPFPAGSGADVAARPLAQNLSAAWQRPVIVENRPGATATIGMDAAAKAPPDGYTLAFGAPAPLTILPHLMKLPFDPLKDFVPITLVTAGPIMLVAHPKAPFDSLAQLIKYSRSDPGQVKVAGYGVGSIGHLATLMIAKVTGADLTHVPYQGGPQQVTDVISGQVPLLLDFESQVAPHLTAGKLKALAVAAERRMPNMPEVPTFAELGYSGLVISAWTGILVRAGTPPAIVRKLSSDIAGALASPELRELYTSRGVTDIGSESPEAFAAFIRNEHDRWGRVIREAGVRLD